MVGCNSLKESEYVQAWCEASHTDMHQCPMASHKTEWSLRQLFWSIMRRDKSFALPFVVTNKQWSLSVLSPFQNDTKQIKIDLIGAFLKKGLWGLWPESCFVFDPLQDRTLNETFKNCIPLPLGFLSGQYMWTVSLPSSRRDTRPRND